MTWVDEDGERRYGEPEDEWQRTRDMHAIWEREREERRLASFTPRACTICGQSFVPWNSGILRCPECCRRTNESLGRPAANIETKSCAICSTPFTGPAQWKRCGECRKVGRTIASANRNRQAEIFDTFRWSEALVLSMAHAMREATYSKQQRGGAIARVNEMANAAERQGVDPRELRTLAAHLKYGEAS